jgi:hypothetical protein
VAALEEACGGVAVELQVPARLGVVTASEQSVAAKLEFSDTRRIALVAEIERAGHDSSVEARLEL